MAGLSNSSRIKSTGHNSAVSSGYLSSPVHIPSGATNFQVAAQGAVVCGWSINTAPGTGAVLVSMGGQLIASCTQARDYRIPFFVPVSSGVTVSLPDTTADVTFYIAPANKGVVQA
jgi:hypothetical protein